MGDINAGKPTAEAENTDFEGSERVIDITVLRDEAGATGMRANKKNITISAIDRSKRNFDLAVEGDKIIAVNGVSVTSYEDLKAMITDLQEFTMTLRRV